MSLQRVCSNTAWQLRVQLRPAHFTNSADTQTMRPQHRREMDQGMPQQAITKLPACSIAPANRQAIWASDRAAFHSQDFFRHLGGSYTLLP
jgi:hypothetical protein